MFGFLGKAFSQYRKVDLKASSVRYIRTKTIPSPKSPHQQQPLTVSYLTDSCGLSLDKAISASKWINLKNTEGPDSVLRLLQSYGFTKSDIATLISKHPRCLMANPEKTLRPKIEFFESLGIVGESLTKVICSKERILQSSLKKQIIPFVDFVKGNFGTGENIVCSLKSLSTWSIFWCNPEKTMAPNISTLRAQGVPEGHIQTLLVWHPRAFTCNVDFFEEMVHEVKAMGFEPAKKSFIYALRPKTAMSKETWEKKKEFLMSYGWLEEQFQSAFVHQPVFMLTSEKKIEKVMDFLLNTAGLKSSDVAKCPNLLLCSLEKRLIPRWLFMKVLMSKGLIKPVELTWFLTLSNSVFERRYVIEYEKDAPEVIKAYRDGTGFKDLVTDCNT
ncbi:hypothetical protein SLEP1_g48899 [Rubroshorea leprosula]|uniref:Uncharacterized protein n=1 Tax=Rubroshorea leprosula TaxID=152421 RepID=A0AAV5LX79_9ROSI|nr:hypothetical protein SLEP1_g48899 [Rubroshorea leprosula]